MPRPDTDALADLVVQAIKASQAPLLERIAALEARQVVDGRDGRDGPPGPTGAKGDAGDRGPDGATGPQGREGRDGLPGVSGAQGTAGEKGADGLHGKDGAPGRDGTLENLKAVYDGERTLTFCFKNGDPIEGGVLTLPIVIDRGVYRAGVQYQKGDAVSYAGSFHIAQMATAATPEDGRAWRLAVKRGRDGKDGRDAPGALPMVSVGGRG